MLLTSHWFNRNGDLTDKYEIRLLSINHCNEQNVILEVFS